MADEIIYSRTGTTSNSVMQSVITDNPESSELISAILSSDNIINEELYVFRQWAFICECAIRHIHNMDTFVTGSRIDCSSSPSSDDDQMIQMKNTEVTCEEDLKVSQAENVMIMSTKDSSPGYAVLRIYKLSDDLQRHETKSCLESCIQSGGAFYLSSDRYLRYVMNLITGMDKYSPMSFHAGESLRHGPCVMLNYGDHGMDSDMGIALRCSAWPKESIEWISRRRKSNWPDEILIDKIKKMPCHVLPVGYPNSKNCHLEWRFAFVMPERELIWNFNDVQIQCFVIFKTLQKEILDKISTDEINSFHLKTIVFWLSEEITHWDEVNLIDNVKKCLSFLNKSIEERHLSHYFLKSRNLFAEKLKDETVRTRLSSEILNIQKNVLQCFLNCEWRYKYENGYLLTLRILLRGQRQSNFLDIGRTVLHITDRNFRRNKYTHARSLSMEVTMGIMFLQTNVDSLIKIAEEVADHLKDTLMGIFALKFLSIRVGMLCLVEAKRTADNDARQNFVSEAKWYFETGLEHDVLAATMYLLTYHYQARNYAIIGKFLTDLLCKRIAIPYKGTPGLITCGNRTLLSPDMDDTVTEKDMANENDVAFDVIFSFMDISCVPPAIQYECALLEGRCNWSFCSVNPLVYACYVQFQVAFNQRELEQQRFAVEHLKKMVLYVENGEENFIRTPVERHRHYNILGYCYCVMNDQTNAITWFVKSLEACPTVGNAAAYQLCIAIYSSEYLFS